MSNYAFGLEGDGSYAGTGWRLTRILNTAVDLAVEKMKKIVPDNSGSNKPIEEIIDEKLKNTHSTIDKLEKDLTEQIKEFQTVLNGDEAKLNSLQEVVTQVQNKCALLDELDTIKSGISSLENDDKSILSKINNIDQTLINIPKTYTRKIDLQNSIMSYINTNILEQNSRFQPMIKREFLNDFYNEISAMTEITYVPIEFADKNYPSKLDLDKVKTTLDNKIENNYLSKEDAANKYVTIEVFNPVKKAQTKNTTSIEEIQKSLQDLDTRVTQTFTNIDSNISYVRTRISDISKDVETLKKSRIAILDKIDEIDEEIDAIKKFIYL